MSQRTIGRAQVMAYRWRAHQLDRPAGCADDAALLDFGVQDTGNDGAAWALAVRGVRPSEASMLAWTLRGAPHRYRLADAKAVTVATAPLSEADAASRIFDSSRALRAAGIAVLEALTHVAGLTRRIVTGPMAKGAVSTALTAQLDRPYLRECRPCRAVHCGEMTFRLPALQAGLALTPGTSPPVLRRITGVRPSPYARLGGDADERFHVVRNYLRFYGPATVPEAAKFLDAPVRDVQAAWPSDAVPVTLDDDGPRVRRHVLATDLDALTAADVTTGVARLVGPYDAYLQGRDRSVLVPDTTRHKALWPVLGRPGAVLVDGEVAGVWRPRSSGGKLSLRVELWTPLRPPARKSLSAEAERLATHRGCALSSVDVS
ncbi:crosslink repair DNA glycosylase YcaQ family protein [Pilimelia columellifera subsp. columellifera]|uniref:Crosslink repair DNA glycosylase YcaQ family protein n=2 Tax=Pilimelia TaxID=53370 RepID=A0ABN3NK95_9ACTN